MFNNLRFIRWSEAGRACTLIKRSTRPNFVIVGRYSHDGDAKDRNNHEGTIDLNTYQKISDETLETLSENLESYLEDRYDKGADVRLESGVLTVIVDQQTTYVINKQTPNRQIWFSSPLSGPKRFDLELKTNRWIERTTKLELNKLLSEELSSLMDTKIKV